jgi:hypothetical protein
MSGSTATEACPVAQADGTFWQTRHAARLGPWDLALYLLSFVAIGFLWTRAALRRRGVTRKARRPLTSAEQDRCEEQASVEDPD